MHTLQSSLPTYLDQAISYTEYLELGSRLLNENKTSGTDHSPEMIEYTRMNEHRVHRILKKGKVHENTRSFLEQFDRKVTLLILTEFWCGDAAQNLPWFHLMFQNAPNIEMKVLFRDEHPGLMDAFLTNGARAIPKVIFLDDQNEVFATWGPRPASAQEIILENKRTGALPKEEVYKKLHLWYAQNEGKEIQTEICNLMEIIR
jgi:hypothetical protein